MIKFMVVGGQCLGKMGPKQRGHATRGGGKVMWQAKGKGWWLDL
jgi:hypothetical protein